MRAAEIAFQATTRPASLTPSAPKSLISSRLARPCLDAERASQRCRPSGDGPRVAAATLDDDRPGGGDRRRRSGQRRGAAALAVGEDWPWMAVPAPDETAPRTMLTATPSGAARRLAMTTRVKAAVMKEPGVIAVERSRCPTPSRARSSSRCRCPAYAEPTSTHSAAKHSSTPARRTSARSSTRSFVAMRMWGASRPPAVRCSIARGSRLGPETESSRRRTSAVDGAGSARTGSPTTCASRSRTTATA